MTINETGKTCADCKEWKTFDNFYKKKGRKDPYLSYCKPCCKIRNKKNYNANKEQRQQYQRDNTARIRQQVYDAYGNKCACCGEAEYMFLSIDHVNNDGAEHRRSFGNQGRGKSGSGNGAGTQLYYVIIKENFPDRYQLLCMNCNFGKQRNGGVCPHDSQ